MERCCRECVYWKQDRGTWSVTGWTGLHRDIGDCQFNPQTVRKDGDSFCREWKWVEDVGTKEETG
jgi:hypothetical protein